MSPYSPEDALNPYEPFPSLTLARITEDSSPAFETICLSGASKAFLAILTPTF